MQRNILGTHIIRRLQKNQIIPSIKNIFILHDFQYAFHKALFFSKSYCNQKFQYLVLTHAKNEFFKYSYVTLGSFVFFRVCVATCFILVFLQTLYFFALTNIIKQGYFLSWRKKFRGNGFLYYVNQKIIKLGTVKLFIIC